MDNYIPTPSPIIPNYIPKYIPYYPNYIVIIFPNYILSMSPWSPLTVETSRCTRLWCPYLSVTVRHGLPRALSDGSHAWPTYNFLIKNDIFPWQTVELPQGRQFRNFLVFSLSLSLVDIHMPIMYVCMFQKMSWLGTKPGMVEIWPKRGSQCFNSWPNVMGFSGIKSRTGRDQHLLEIAGTHLYPAVFFFNHRAAETSAMCHNVKLGFIQRLNLGEQKLGICQRTNRSVAKTDGARNNPAFNMAMLDTVRHKLQEIAVCHCPCMSIFTIR